MKNIIEKLLTKTLCYPVKHIHLIEVTMKK